MAHAKGYGDLRGYNAPLGTDTFVFEDDGVIPNNTLPLDRPARRDLNPPPPILLRRSKPLSRRTAGPIPGATASSITTITTRPRMRCWASSRAPPHVQFGGEGGEVVGLTAGDVVVIPAGVGHALIKGSGRSSGRRRLCGWARFRHRAGGPGTGRFRRPRSRPASAPPGCGSGGRSDRAARETVGWLTLPCGWAETDARSESLNRSGLSLQAMNWRDYWNQDTPIYVSERHKLLHYWLIANDIVALIPSPEAAVLDYGCGEALAATAWPRGADTSTCVMARRSCASACRRGSRTNGGSRCWRRTRWGASRIMASTSSSSIRCCNISRSTNSASSWRSGG